jgi:hypothetical protein
MDPTVIFAIAGCLLSAGMVYVALKVLHFGETQEIAAKLSKLQLEADALKKKLAGYTKYLDGLEAGKMSLADALRPPVAKVVREYVFSTNLSKEEFHLVADATAIVTYSVEFGFNIDVSAAALELKPVANGLGLRINRPVLAGDPLIKTLSHRVISAISIANDTLLLPAIQSKFVELARRYGTAMSSEPTVLAACKLKAMEALRDALAAQPGVRQPPAIFVDFK